MKKEEQRKEIKLSKWLWIALGGSVAVLNQALAYLYLEEEFAATPALKTVVLGFMVVGFIYIQCKLVEQFVK